jgi:pyruvate dehydrogenase E1 component beta subunit
MRYLSRGKLTVPLVVRASAGAGQGFGCQHSTMLDHWFRGTPGAQGLRGERRADGYGLLRSAIDDPDPVVVLEPRVLYGEREEWDPDTAYRIRWAPRSCADPARTPPSLPRAPCCPWRSRPQRRPEPRSSTCSRFGPWDRKTVLASVGTHRPGSSLSRRARGAQVWGAEVAAEATAALWAKCEPHPCGSRCPDAPVPYNGGLEKGYLPSAAQVAAQTRHLIDRGSDPCLVETDMTLSNVPDARSPPRRSRRPAGAARPHDRDPDRGGRDPAALHRRPCARLHPPRQRAGGGGRRHRPKPVA